MADNFEAWCTPVSLPLISNVADHVFIYAPDQNKSFGCWGTSNRNAPDAARVLTARGDKAFCKANKYRGPLDSACLGIYAVNGVCHQSANLFLYPTNACLPLNKSRPRAVIATHLLWGVYGTLAPGDLPSAPGFFTTWLAAIYGQAYLRCRISWFKKASRRRGAQPRPTARRAPRTLPEKIRALYEAPQTTKAARAGAPLNYVAEEMDVVLGHYLPSVRAPDFRKAHEQILAEKDELLTGLGLAGPDVPANLPPSIDLKRFVNGLNDLSMKAQDGLHGALGPKTYKKLTGDTKIYAPVSPVLARKSFASLGVRVL